MTGLFMIGTTDLTPWEKTDQHNVNRDDVYETWTDANWVDHRVVVRRRVSGSVVLTFARAADYSAFLSLLASEKDANGAYPVTVYCAEAGATETITAYLDITGATAFDVTAPMRHQTVTVSVTER